MSPQKPDETRDDDSAPTTVSLPAPAGMGDHLPAEPRPARVDRFPLLDTLGRGGMGVVYAGYDDRLDRRVALKVLQPERNARSGEGDRLWREARAMARVSHPNVATVHEVGWDRDGRVFIVMEFIDGQTLTRWLQTGPAWQAVLGAFVDAGLGLLAAHELGLVHRDFKPSNVMRTPTGAIKVLDFGLARPVGTGMNRPPEGGAVGTVPYMSPEQHSGDDADVRSDQYSFCVSLWAGLTGQLPFEGRSPDAVLAAKLQSRPIWPKSGPAIPARLRDALRRGLAVAPDDRWPSMDALLRELQRDRSQRRRQWSFGLLAAGGAGLTYANAYGWAQDSAQLCTGAQDQLAGVWDESRRAKVQAAILSVDRPYASDAWARSEDALTRYANAWVETHTEACQAANVRGEASVERFDTRMRCLSRARIGLKAVVETLADADDRVVETAHKVVAGLRPLRWCEDATILDAELEPPLPHEAAAVDEARQALARASAERTAGRLEAARSSLEQATKLLAGVTHRPAQADRAVEQGYVDLAQGDSRAAETSFGQAVELAIGHGLDEALFEAASQLMFSAGIMQRKVRQAMLYWPVVNALSRGDDHRKGIAWSMLGLMLSLDGKPEAAREQFAAAVRVVEDAFGPDSLYLAYLRNNFGNVLYAQKRRAEAEVQFREVLRVLEKTLGSAHPHVAMSHNNLGSLLYDQQKLEEAEVELRAAWRGWEGAWGPEHPNVAMVRENLGTLLSSQGRHEDAEREQRAALRLKEKSLGPQHPKVASSRDNLGFTLESQGKFVAAEDQYLQALRSKEQAWGPEHPAIAATRFNLARMSWKQRRYERALRWAQGAWPSYQGSGTLPDSRAGAALIYARILWDVEGKSRDRARAWALATEAAQTYGAAEDRDEARAWLEAHPRP